METTWSGDHRDNMETTAMGMWGSCGTTVMMWGQHGDDGDDMGMTGTTWGPQGHGDHMGTMKSLKMQ